MRLGAYVCTLAAFLLIACAPARALPVFAYRYGFSCQTCHSIVPQLNAFGQDFLRSGYRLPPAFPRRPGFPVAMKINLAYNGGGNGMGLPKAIVDEVELLAGAPVNSHLSYRLEQYLVDGGVPGKTRDAWLEFNSRPIFGDFSTALRVTAGQFTLPLPVDPETQRYTLNHYAIFDQTVGNNPFNLFDDRIGIDAAYGKTPGTDVDVLASLGHDPQSGLRAMGTDRMLYVQQATTSANLSLYRYDGSRPLIPLGDRFWRQGVAISAHSARAEINLLIQQGFDSSANGLGSTARSNGGFAQLRWSLSSAAFAVFRYDRARDGQHESDSITSSLIFRPRSNARFTLEDVAANASHNLNAALLFAY